MKKDKFDKIDKKLLSMLQMDSRVPLNVLADKAGLSTSACHRRIKLLEDAGVIAGYGATLDRHELGYPMEFFVEVSLTRLSEGELEEFEKAVMAIPEILQCHLMSGQSDYMLRIAARSTLNYEEIHRNRLARLPNVARIQSSLALRTVKPWTGYPV
jgi:DNA-binding Lrp family transcriptional regulator